MACNLVGCMKNLSCGQIKETITGTNLAPFVTVGFQDDNGIAITVGNQSDPTHDNHAVIKSFQYGSSNGAGCVIEIIDEEGGNFNKFMDKLNKCIARASDDYQMRIQWGWIDRGCGDVNGKIVSQSPVFFFIPIHVEASFSEGKIRFQVTGSSLLEIAFETRPAEVYGSDDDKILLTEALRRLFAESKPEVGSIKFLRYNSQGNFVDWKFQNEPKQKWESNRQNKLSTAIMWIQKFVTDRGKGVVPIWNPEVPGGELIFFEDPKPGCFENIPWCSRSIGTYLVNGGACSPVLSFTPTAKWVYGALDEAGGGVSKVVGTADKEKGRDGCKVGEDDVGTLTANFATIQAIENAGFKKADEQTQKANAAYESAMKRAYSLEAELRVQGDPTLSGTDKIFGRVASIIQISPFHLVGSSACGDWLAYPGCHPVYSNRAWIIDGVDHHIKEGSYVTTFRLFLASPGSDIDPNEPFGGQNSGGFIPKKTCAN